MLLGLSASVTAAVDLDGDGVDDLYAERYGIVGVHPTNDLDEDGASIYVESHFLTHPDDPSDRPELYLHPSPSARAVWPTRTGVVYRVEESEDLDTWYPADPYVPGDGSTQAVEAVNLRGLGAFRLAAIPLDADGDGLRDVDEAGLGTDPSNPDSDEDGLGDGFEAADPDLDPTVYDDACADANSSGRPDLEDFAATLGTHVVTWVGPGDGSWHEPANWSSGHVPGPLDVALIAPCSPTGPTVRIAAPATAAAILSSGAIDVDAATLALGGYMTARDLDLRGGAQLGPVADHYARLHLGIGGDMTVETGCVVEVTNAGYPATEGPGAPRRVERAGTGGSGGGHGGRGGRGRYTWDEELGSAYGSVTRPVTWGSGSNRGRGAGGGVLRIVVDGHLELDGVLNADAVRDSTAGAGGSIWVDCDTLSGGGAIEANGASAGNLGGAGAGGRIAVYLNDVSGFHGDIEAHGGPSGNLAGAGSVFTRVRSEALGRLVYSNSGVPGSSRAGTTPIPSGELRIDADITVSNGAVLTSTPGRPLRMDTPGDILVLGDGAIDLTGQGWPGGSGPGVAVAITDPGTGAIGGSHGGQGGTGRLIKDPSLLGTTYGSIPEPEDMGSGSNRGGEAGGGALRLICETLVVDGLIVADGETGGGSGAGGSVWISCDDLTGTGTIRANGGEAGSSAGGGGGGRVAVHAGAVHAFAGMLAARAHESGGGNQPGGAGTVYTRIGSRRGTVRFDNGGVSGNVSPVVGSRLDLDVNLEIAAGARVSGGLAQALVIDIPGNIWIASNAFIDVSGRGYGPYEGPGAPPVPDATQQSSGAGHAGMGGRGWRVEPPSHGTMYGSYAHPDRLGSGAGGRGGGALRLVADEITIDGGVLAQGETRPAPHSTGSGGSVWITCARLAGNGRIAANGGIVTGPQVQLGGAGSGGRVAVHTAGSTFAGSYEAHSISENPGGAGTLYLKTGSTDSFILDNGGQVAGAFTAVPRLLDLAGDFVVRGGAVASRVTDVSDPILEVVAQGAIRVEADSRIDYSSQPLGTQVDFSVVPPPLPEMPTMIGGASHAGRGGHGVSPSLIGGPGGSYEYDSLYNPRMPGSGSRAGGIILLAAAGTLTLDGTIAADAGDAPQLTGDSIHGSSGGAILLVADVLTGEGTLSARGGRAHTGSADFTLGGGSGGRIAAYGNVVSPLFTLNLDPGAGDHFLVGLESEPGRPGTYVRACFPLNLVTGDLVEIAPPGDLRAGHLESAVQVFMFPEHMTFSYDDREGGQFTTFEAVNPGTYGASSDLTATLTEKEPWTTYLLHADPPPGLAPVLTASVTFDRDIVGIFATAAAIDESNSWFGSQLPAFGGAFRASAGLELDAGDEFTISPDLRTLTVTFNTVDGLDQLRVVTQPRQMNEWCP